MDASQVDQPPDENVAAETEHAGLGAAPTQEVLPAREPFRSLLHRLGQLEQAVGAALLVVILVLVIVQVVQRNLPGGGWAWTGEIARFAMVWVAFALSGYLMATDGHIAIKVVDYFLPVRALGVLKLLGHLLIAVTATVLAYATYDFIVNTHGQVTPAAEVPLAVMYTVVAFGFASTAVRALLAVFVLDLPEISGREEVAT